MKNILKRMQTIKINSQNIGKMCYAHNEKWKKKWQIKERIQLPNQKRIRRFGEKENHTYTGIAETDDIIKTMKGKEKIEKSAQ